MPGKPAHKRRAVERHRRWIAVVGSVIVLSIFPADRAAGEVLPPPPIAVTLPPPAANAFGVSVAISPNDGLIHVWDGAQVLKQDAPSAATYTSIGNVGSGSADAGPIAFSRDASELLIGNGAGGLLGGANAGLIFSIPATGGNSSTSIATVDFHFKFTAAPLGIANDRFFVNQGNASFSASSVSVLNGSDGSNVSVLENIPGAATAMAINASDRFFVGVGFGPQRGQLRSFEVADLETAYNTATPLDWTSGQVFNSIDNNSAAGLFFDARGFLFAGGPDGVTVFDTDGNSVLFENNGFTSIDYDPLNDRVLVTGFGDHQGLYPASTFLVPEPATAAMAVGWAIVLLARRRRAWRRESAAA